MKNHILKISLAAVLMAAILIYQHSIFCCGYNTDPQVYTPVSSTSQYSIIVDICTCRLYLLQDGKKIKEYTCAVGTQKTPTPIGTFTIVSKGEWTGGFGGHFMGINCSWGKFGIHGTLMPGSIGWASSHGCIRMKNHDAAELYNIVPYGTKVIIDGGPYGPFGTGFRTIKPGMYGSDVLEIQKRLKELSYYSGWCNGHYDAQGFREAVIRYQKKNGLYANGYITPSMQRALGFIEME